MAAPKSLQPDETPLRVKGMMESSTARRIADTIAAGDCDGGFVESGMFDVGEEWITVSRLVTASV
jgi:hypothetical protein